MLYSANIKTNKNINVTVIVLTEVDRLSKSAQHALRRTMEKYVTTCRLILIANSTARVIPAIKSRCLGIRVAAPTSKEICAVLEVNKPFLSLLIPSHLLI